MVLDRYTRHEHSRRSISPVTFPQYQSPGRVERIQCTYHEGGEEEAKPGSKANAGETDWQDTYDRMTDIIGDPKDLLYQKEQGLDFEWRPSLESST